MSKKKPTTVWLARGTYRHGIFPHKPTPGNIKLVSGDVLLFGTTRNTLLTGCIHYLAKILGLRLGFGQAIEVEMRPIGKPVQIVKVKP